MTFGPKYGNERDLEITKLLELLERAQPVASCLDVGAAGTAVTYAAQVRTRVGDYDALDVIWDPAVRAIADRYHVGNLLDLKEHLPSYDVVFSISALEHAGISTYKHGHFHRERLHVFAAMYELTNRELLVTCPFGQPMLIPDQYANVTAEDLAAFQETTGPLDCQFYFTPAQLSPFTQISREDAEQVAFSPEIGIPRCIAIIQAHK